MKTRAAVAFAAKQPLEIVELDLAGPRAGEVLVEIMATGICHTDAYTLDGLDSEGIFPSVLGHEGAGVVREVGEGVTSVKPGDHVIPLYTPECGQCKSCLSGKTNLCTAIRATQGKGVMPDGTSRFSLRGETVLHYMGTSTFANYTVVPEIAWAFYRAATSGDAPTRDRLLASVALPSADLLSCLYVVCGPVDGSDTTRGCADVLPAWREVTIFSARERAALAWTEALTRLADQPVSDACFTEVRTQFSEKEIVNLSAAIATINAWNRIAVGFNFAPNF